MSEWRGLVGRITCASHIGCLRASLFYSLLLLIGCRGQQWPTVEQCTGSGWPEDDQRARHPCDNYTGIQENLRVVYNNMEYTGHFKQGPGRTISFNEANSFCLNLAPSRDSKLAWPVDKNVNLFLTSIAAYGMLKKYDNPRPSTGALFGLKRYERYNQGVAFSLFVKGPPVRYYCWHDGYPLYTTGNSSRDGECAVYSFDPLKDEEGLPAIEIQHTFGGGYKWKNAPCDGGAGGTQLTKINMFLCQARADTPCATTTSTTTRRPVTRGTSQDLLDITGIPSEGTEENGGGGLFPGGFLDGGLGGLFPGNTKIENLCLREPCKNGGECIPKNEWPSTYHCICPFGYLGPTCSNKYAVPTIIVTGLILTAVIVMYFVTRVKHGREALGRLLKRRKKLARYHADKDDRSSSKRSLKLPHRKVSVGSHGKKSRQSHDTVSKSSHQSSGESKRSHASSSKQKKSSPAGSSSSRHKTAQPRATKRS